jgi:hypothetical protein
MKVVDKPIDMIVRIDKEGVQHPVRFRMDTESEEKLVVQVGRVVTRDFDKIAGKPTLILRCQSSINGIEKTYEIRYELGTCKWILYKF